MTQKAVRMKPKTPSEEELAWIKENIRYNPQTGVVWNDRRAEPGGPQSSSNKYVAIHCLTGNYKAHRVAWFLHTGQWPSDKLVVDHINGIRNDNRWINIRLATNLDNNRNKHPGQKIEIIAKKMKMSRIPVRIDAHENYSSLSICDKLTLLFDTDGNYMTTKE